MHLNLCVKPVFGCMQTNAIHMNERDFYLCENIEKYCIYFVYLCCVRVSCVGGHICAVIAFILFLIHFLRILKILERSHTTSREA